MGIPAEPGFNKGKAEGQDQGQCQPGLRGVGVGVAVFGIAMAMCMQAMPVPMRLPMRLPMVGFMIVPCLGAGCGRMWHVMGVIVFVVRVFARAVHDKG